MGFEWIELSIIGIIVVLIAIFVAFYKVKKESKRAYKTSYSFLVMGIIWIVFGLVYRDFQMSAHLLNDFR